MQVTLTPAITDLMQRRRGLMLDIRGMYSQITDSATPEVRKASLVDDVGSMEHDLDVMDNTIVALLAAVVKATKA